jgi:succinate dehydrogenase / fumarate reductase iron-sulfur subunit
MSVIEIKDIINKFLGIKENGNKSNNLKKIDKIHVKIKRQDSIDSKPYYQEFLIPYKEHMNVIMLLMYIRENPVDINGVEVKPIAFEASCLEEVCGSCTMVINGKPRQACSTLIENLEQPIVIEPLSKFKVIRDLIVDRSKMFEGLKKVRAWVDIDGTYDKGPGPIYSQEIQQIRYALSRCMTCGACLEVCPQYNDITNFVGPYALAQAYLFNLHPTGKNFEKYRLSYLISKEGIANCGNAQLCVQVCPKSIPITDAIAELNDSITKYLLTLISK